MESQSMNNAEWDRRMKEKHDLTVSIVREMMEQFANLIDKKIEMKSKISTKIKIEEDK